MNEAVAQLWSPPGATGPVVSRRRRVEDLSALEREAWDRGYGAGREAGEVAARRELQAQAEALTAQVQRFDAMAELLGRPLHALDGEVEQQLAAAVLAVARAVVRRELKAQPDDVIGLVRECVKRLPLAAREVRVHLHPDDAALLRERLVEPAGGRAWQIVEDPVLARGGCEVRSENSLIDARVESLLNAAVAALLGDERAAGSRGART